MDDRETNPPLGFKSEASIFHALAGTKIQTVICNTFVRKCYELVLHLISSITKMTGEESAGTTDFSRKCVFNIEGN